MNDQQQLTPLDALRLRQELEREIKRADRACAMLKELLRLAKKAGVRMPGLQPRISAILKE